MIDFEVSDKLHAIVQKRIASWHAGHQPDASGALADFPELRNAKSLVMDLALAEYSLRTAAGDSISKRDFCDKFPVYRQSIAKLIEVQEFLDQCPRSATSDESHWPIPGDEFLGFREFAAERSIFP